WHLPTPLCLRMAELLPCTAEPRRPCPKEWADMHALTHSPTHSLSLSHTHTHPHTHTHTRTQLHCIRNRSFPPWANIIWPFCFVNSALKQPDVKGGLWNASPALWGDVCLCW